MIRTMIDCGHVMGKIESDDGELLLTLMSPTDSDNDAPTELCIWDLNGLKNLYVALGEALAQWTEENPLPDEAPELGERE